MKRLTRRGTLVLAAFAVFALPIAVNAAGGFTDVADDSVFKADIDWLASAGVTKGCNPPDNTEFCPADNVTREQMAAFMHRLATNKVVDAATAVDATNADNATNATNADALDGMSVDDLMTKTFFRQALTGSIGSIGPVEVPGELLTLTFEVPVAGSIMVTHSTSVKLDGTDTAYAVGPTLSESCPVAYFGLFAYGAVETDHEFDSAAGLFPFPVAAGSHTVRLCGVYETAPLEAFSAQIGVHFEPGGTAGAATVSSGSFDPFGG